MHRARVAVDDRSLPAEAPVWHTFRVAARQYEDAAHSQCSFYLEPVDGAALRPFRPGQFLTFSMAWPDGSSPETPDDPILTRCYSLSDRPDPAHYRVTIKRVDAPAGRPDAPGGRASGHFHARVQVGDTLQAKAPAGQFCIDADPAIPVVLIAGGIGITPLLSMLLWCLNEQPGRQLHLYYGVRDSTVHAFKQPLEQLALAHPEFNLHIVYSRPAPGDAAGLDFRHRGHVDLDLVRTTLPHGRHHFYVCGPAAMMSSLVPALARWGVAPQDIRSEAFGPASLASAGPPVGAHSEPPERFELQFKRSGRTLVWGEHDESLLDFALRHGVAMDSGCRAGSCGSCETRLLSGAVRYAMPPEHEPAPGYCLPCVSRPACALVLQA